MWYLESTANATTVSQFWLVAGRHTVGRKGAIALVNDKSVSRHHATVIVAVSFDCKDEQSIPSIQIEDKSKFGTSVNGERLQKGETYNLCDGSLIEFGVSKSVFVLRWKPLLLCVSRADKASKKRVKVLAMKIGAHITSVWCSRCTHLVLCGTFAITFKVIWALLQSKPIITPRWLSDVAGGQPTSMSNGTVHKLRTTLPQIQSYLPEGQESYTCQLLPNSQRNQMFQGFTFIFTHPSDYSDIVEAGQAQTIRLFLSTVECTDDDFQKWSKNDTCFVYILKIECFT